MSTPPPTPTPPPPRTPPTQPEFSAVEGNFYKTVSATVLAKAIFKGVAISTGVNLEEKKRAKKKVQKTDNKRQQEETDRHRREWGLAGLEVMKKFEVYHLAAADPFTTKWKATIGDATDMSIAQVQKLENRMVPFCCQRCKSKNIWFVLGVGKLVLENGIGCIAMEKVFYHDKDCQLDAIRKMPVAEFSVVNFDFGEIMGDTYAGVVNKMSTMRFQDEDQPAPPGHAINFGEEDYNYDDRCYEYLPSDRYPEVDADRHQMAMCRFFFLLTAYLNMAGETAFALLDMEKVKEHVATAGSPLPPGAPEAENTSAHLFFFEISLLFGGHCMQKDPNTTPVHQMCHKDGETRDNVVEDNQDLKGLHKPGSFIIPLDQERTIYVCTPMLQVTAKKGQFIWFHGALPHGGITYKASVDGCDWKPAIHGHLDSSKHTRVQGYFDFESSDDVYFPLEHCKYQKDQFPVLDKGVDAVYTALQVIQSRNRDKCELDNDQAMKYNSMLVGWSSKDLDLLVPKKNLGPAVVLDQMKETVKRLEQLIAMSHITKVKPKGKGKTEENRKQKELRALVEKLEPSLQASKEGEASANLL
jgi:hypothetical protein